MVVRSDRAGRGLSEWLLDCAFFWTHKDQARRPVAVLATLRTTRRKVQMNLARVAASRSRSVQSSDFSRDCVSYATPNGAFPDSSSSPYAWKRTVKERIWATGDQCTIHAGRLFEALVEFANANGRAWPGIQTLLYKTKIKTERTLRKALKWLVRSGWLRIVPQTWTSLTAIQAADGKKLPHRTDAGQGPNLYIVLDGHGREVGSSAPVRPGLAYVSTNMPIPEVPSTPSSSSRKTVFRVCRGGPLQTVQGGPPVDLQVDLDHVEISQMKESVERAQRVDTSTPPSSKSRRKNPEPDVDVQDLDAWTVIVEAHVEKTKAMYGLPPLRPDLKRDQRQELGALLNDAAANVRAKLLQRTDTERELVDVRRELVKRAMDLYFKHDSPYLRRTKYALRDLAREFHARLTEAMQALLRESDETAPPRRQLHELRPVCVETADKPVEVTEPVKVDPPVKHAADKPLEVEMPTSHVRLVQPPPAPTDGAREARRILEMLKALNTSPPGQELFKRPNMEPAQPVQQAEHPRASSDKPTQDMVQHVDESRAEVEPPPTVDKPAEDRAQPVKRVDPPRTEVEQLRAEVEQLRTQLEHLRADLERPRASVDKPVENPSQPAQQAERPRAKVARPRASADKPAVEPVREAFEHIHFVAEQLERKPYVDKPTCTLQQEPPFVRLFGPPGAPRWGAIGPRPVKVRRFRRHLPDVRESEEEQGVGSTSKR